MKPLAIAVISDLHVGKGARHFELRPGEKRPKFSSPSYVETFRKLTSRENLKADFLVVPGDLTHSGAPEEFEKASQVIQKCADALRVPEDRILFVPGNHDVHWPVCALDDNKPTVFWANYKFAPFSDADGFLSSAKANKGGLLCRSPYFSIVTYDDVIFVCFNTSAFENHTEQPHHGLVRQEDLEHLEIKLGELDVGSRVKCAVAHHHPINYSDIPAEWPDFSSLVNAQNLMALLDRHRFDLVIHGHKHLPRFRMQTEDMTHSMPVLAAGSFSYALPETYDFAVSNQFHMIELRGRDVRTGGVFGQLMSWAHASPHGWTQSRPDVHGIDFRIPFGRHASFQELAELVTQLVDGVPSHRQAIRWEQLVQNNELLESLSGETVWRILNAVSANTKRAIDLHGERKSLHNLLLLLEERD